MKKAVLVISVLFFIACNAQKESKGQEYNEVYSTPNFQVKHIKVSKTIGLDPKIAEGSGLLAWNSQLWAINDSGEPILFSIDTLTGKITGEYRIPVQVNEDWEDLSQDDSYFYIGAFGNNSNKKDSLKIYRISKTELKKNSTVVDSITFTWPVIISNKKKKKKNNFDCEAMAVIDNQIFLFTKEWKKQQCTKVFTLPKDPGIYTAKYETTLETKILITGANYNTTSRNLVLCGYNLFARPYLFVFPNFNSSNLLGGQAQKIVVKRSFRQVEGIATFDGINYYLINENLRFLLIYKDQQINKVSLKN